MAYYVSAIQGSKRSICVGPFHRHGDALRHVEPFRHWAKRNTREGADFTTAYGTAHHKTSHRLGRLNDAYGVTVDADGWAV